MTKFKDEIIDRIKRNKSNKRLLESAKRFFIDTVLAKYSYNFSALGRPIIQYPQDMIAMQEIIWEVKPDLIIETGIAHGGSLVMNASMLALLDMSDAINEGVTAFNPMKSKRKVLGIDIDIRPHNKEAIKDHFMSSRIQMIQGSSIDYLIIEEVKKIASDYKRILISLDSNHTHKHVLKELEAYASLTSIGSYCVVFDTAIENLNPSSFWGPGNSPMTAVKDFLKHHPEFEIDKNIDNKILISAVPCGFLKRVC